MGKPVVFLDFDGVICDSVNECFVSSWMAYSQYRDSEPTAVSLSEYQTFRDYRPFIRGGADYLLLQRCIDLSIHLTTQDEFDEQVEVVGERGMDEFHRQFYAVRSELLKSDKSYWLKLNRFFPGVEQPLRSLTAEAWILTTKEASFAHEIITSQGFDWSLDKIICSGKERKVEIIEKIIERDDTAVFIDDQIDHFNGEVDPRISCYLASWGYVRPDWLEENVEVLNLHGFAELLGSL